MESTRTKVKILQQHNC